jgi:hypothetical protein
LRWTLQWGPHLEFLLDEEEHGRPVPALDEMPELVGSNMLSWTAFTELSSQRQQGFSASPISIQDILAWMDLNRIEQDLRLMLFDHIRELDQCLLAHLAEKAKRNANSSSSNQRSGSAVRRK